MKKVGIITLNGNFNYGNRLQNYALQQIIKNNGYMPETIINVTRVNNEVKNECKSNVELFISGDLTMKINIIVNKIIYDFNKINIIKKNIEKKSYKIKCKREEIFKEFSKKFINETKFSISANNIPVELVNKYNYFIAGSDQVWNPNDPIVSEINFLTFAPKNKRLSYAPSFGVSSIDKSNKRRYAEMISGIEKLSVREEEGAKLIKELTGRDAQVVIDPTMLIDKKEWISISKVDKNKPKKKYLLTYFLGEKSDKTKKKIKYIAKTNKLEVVNLASLNDKKYYLAGPCEFIDYVNDASLFLTDSFHGCVFSLMLQTPFIVFYRESQNHNNIMNSRIDTFIKKFKLESRKFENINKVDLFNYDYEEAYEILEIEKVKSLNYLKNALNI